MKGRERRPAKNDKLARRFDYKQHNNRADSQCRVARPSMPTLQG